MTRVTPLPRELAKLTRSMGSTISTPRTSQLLVNSGARAVAAKLQLRKELENAPNAAQVPASERTLTTAHRPTSVPIPNPHRNNVPLMQGFHTTQPRPARSDESTIDFAFLPTDLESASPSTASPALRYPLLPDSFASSGETLGAALFAPEAVDAPLRAPEIVVLAADPAAVNVVSALSEVEGMGPDGVELRFGSWQHGGEEGGEGEEYAGGMLTGLWKGLVDDVLNVGGAKGPKVAL
ncbi:unnamed protein product [Discula destructiva]